jgi:hypothetical protein
LLRKAVTHPLVRRVTLREYLPLAAMLSFWGLAGLSFGHADAVRLFAAYTFFHAIRSLCALEMGLALIRRLGNEPAFRRSRRTAFRIDLLVLVAALSVTALFAWFLDWRGMEKVALMMLILVVGFPARHPGVALLARRDREVPWRLGAAVTVLVGAALVWQLQLGWWQAALVLAAKEWGSLLFTLLFARRRPLAEPVAAEPLTFAELAARTEASARRRLTYRMAKSVLSGALGPFGTFIARTGRGARLDARISRMVPRHRGGMVVLTLVSTALTFGLLLLSTEPAMLVVAAATSRIAASGGSSLLWWRYGETLGADEDDDDD